MTTRIRGGPNIIAVNLDFRDSGNDGQPFLFNSPGNAAPHTYTGIAVVNFRSNVSRIHQFCGNCDHVLLIHNTMLQDESTSFRVHLRGFPRNVEGVPEARYENVRIRGNAFENLQISASNTSSATALGDLPSYWLLLDSDHIFLELKDLVNRTLDPDDYPECDDEGDPEQMMIFPTGDWSAQIVSPPTLIGLDENKVMYLTDAGGKERVGAIGAVESLGNSLGSLTEMRTFDVDSGTRTDGELADLIFNDDLYVEVDADQTSLIVDVQAEFYTAVETPDSLIVTVASSISYSSDNAKIRLWNWSKADWDDVDTYTIGASEVVRVKDEIPPGSFVQSSDGLIRVSWWAEGDALQIPLAAAVDLLRVEVVE